MKPEEDNFRLSYPRLVINKMRVAIFIVGLAIVAFSLYLLISNIISINIFLATLFVLFIVFFGIAVLVGRHEQKQKTL